MSDIYHVRPYEILFDIRRAMDMSLYRRVNVQETMSPGPTAYVP